MKLYTSDEVSNMMVWACLAGFILGQALVFLSFYERIFPSRLRRQ